jgi:hypothetical protein
MKTEVNHGHRSVKARFSLGLGIMLVAVAALVAPAPTRHASASVPVTQAATTKSTPVHKRDECEDPRHLVSFGDYCECVLPGETHGTGVICPE